MQRKPKKYKEKEEKPERDYSKVKLFPNLMKAVLDCSRQIFFEKKYADKVIERMLKSNSQWGARDRAFIAEYTYDMVRWWRLLQYMSGIKENETGVKMPLMFAALWVWNGHDLPEWEEFRGFDKAKMFRLFDDAQSQRKIRESIPDWLDALGERELGPKWDAEIKALNNQADLVVRANTLKITRAGLLRKLEDEHIEASPIDDLPDAIVLHKRINLFATRFIKDGLLEVQDAASQLVADFLEVEPGMRVIDACAGAGGKSLHIAALMQNKGRLISMDIEEFKLEELKKRARRAGVGNIETRVIESSKTIKRLQETADRLLLDVPCSGLGVLRRNPDAKWKMGLDFIINIRKKQLEILQNYSIMLKPGGKMVYATCSILPSEDEEQVQTFLAANPNFELERQERISVAETGFDGFYMALISKKVSVADTE
jgi:16S rRNA (cytosine967-C5)-methyltransferase